MFYRSGKRIGIQCLAAGMIVSAALSGCTESAPEEEKKVIVEQEAAAVDYSLVAVTRNDFISSRGVRCTYSQFHMEDLSFAVSGKLVSKVYVKDGDTVEKGTLLAELSGGSREDEIERLQYQINRNQMLLEQVDDTENYEISRRWLNKIYNKGFDQTGDIPNLQKENEYRREDYRDAIALDQQQLDQVKKEVRQSKLTAGISGTVTIMKDRLEGSTSVKDEVVIRVKDNSERFFAVSDMSYLPYVRDGETLTMSVVTGPGRGTYQVEPYKKETWTDQMFFSIVDGDDGIIFESGDTGTITFILDSRMQVLTLPQDAVHGADGKWYVYVINESGGREIKWVEVGLQGNNIVEIISGLEEGEKVILR